MISVDIETEPLPTDQLLEIYRSRDPYVPPEPLGEFDPTSVKCGNLKDQAKINEKIAAARNAHYEAAANFTQQCIRESDAHWNAFADKAALCATTGRVVAIGLLNSANNKSFIYDCGMNDDTAEAAAITRFWQQFTKVRKAGGRMIGVNINEFDLPFLIRRSWKLGVTVPEKIQINNRYWCDTFVDLCERFYLGQRNGKPSASFKAMAEFFSTEGKPDNGVTGKEFAKFWREDREAATEYLLSDLKQPVEWAVAMGVT